MEQFDKPVWSSILLNLPLRDLLQQCRTNKRTSIVCNSDDFWREYLRKNYDVELLPNLNAKEATLAAQRYLERLWKSKLFMSSKSLEFLLNYVKNKDIIDFIDLYTDQNIISSLFLEEGNYEELQEEIFKFPFPQFESGDLGEYSLGPGDHVIYNPITVRNIRKYLNIIEESTIYPTSRGLVSLPYNEDKVAYLEIHGRGNLNIPQEFEDYLQEWAENIRQKILLKNLL